MLFSQNNFLPLFNIHSRRLDENRTSLPSVTENRCANESEDSECALENYVGNVYIGSPQRRRHYLEPLNVHKKVPSPKGKDQKKTVLYFHSYIAFDIYYTN